MEAECSLTCSQGPAKARALCEIS